MSSVTRPPPRGLAVQRAAVVALHHPDRRAALSRGASSRVHEVRRPKLRMSASSQHSEVALGRRTATSRARCPCPIPAGARAARSSTAKTRAPAWAAAAAVPSVEPSSMTTTSSTSATARRGCSRTVGDDRADGRLLVAGREADRHGEALTGLGLGQGQDGRPGSLPGNERTPPAYAPLGPAGTPVRSAYRLLPYTLIKSGRGTGPMTPRQPATASTPAGETRCQCLNDEQPRAVPPLEALESASREPGADCPRGPARRSMASRRQGLRCRECGREYEVAPVYTCEWCFGPLEVTYDYDAITARRSAARRSPPGPRASGATPTCCPSTAAMPSTSAPASRRWCAPTASPPSSASARCGSRTTR